MPNKISKFKNWFSTAKTSIAVSRIVLTGKPVSKHLDKIEKGSEIADKALEIWDILKRKNG